jgi:hypothetical protein
VTGIGHRSVTVEHSVPALHDRIGLKKNKLADFFLGLEYSLDWQFTCLGELCLQLKDRLWKLRRTSLNFG